jgi:hypothetical protein
MLSGQIPDTMIPGEIGDFAIYSVSTKDEEAAAVLSYARAMGRKTLHIDGVFWNDLYLYDIHVLDWTDEQRQAA